MKVFKMWRKFIGLICMKTQLNPQMLLVMKKNNVVYINKALEIPSANNFPSRVKTT